MSVIPYARQNISGADIDAVVEVLGSDWLTQGPTVDEFEQAVSGRCGAPYGVAVSSGTAALHLACRALGLGEGDLLWTSPITFVASANCARYCGADVDFVDIDPRTYNMSVAALKEKLEYANRRGRLPKVVIPVHFAGQPCEMDRIQQLAQEYGFAVIEDASHAIGARYCESSIGASTWSDITVFSFHPVKLITTGEGGMALTRRADLDRKLRLLRSHGITRDPSEMANSAEGAWYYEQVELGYNYRLTDIQAALGLRQLDRLDEFVARRRELVARYDAALHDLPVVRPWQHPAAESAWHLYVIQVNPEAFRGSRAGVFTHLRSSGIGVNVHYIPVHMQPYYQRLGAFGVGSFPEAERYYANAITLPLYFGLSKQDQDRVIAELKRAMG